ncbi:5-carboxymethyl-2-hydroxymuconate Delta-isomerase [Paraburkholderia phenoliruptrix]|uniref:5-carboxymethyl-2-hydroxymuconate Delta-isomerase n=1 Tax=Paraburkholderia phenoliruptrix TaxID=252970 RepID=UPI001C6EF644|nr:5-carboxymethyl-2-hydroxymuconate Delta-isomerase [Paraburkholderia phenoliruptrix]MBW9107445.1 5-carboxymethyl-2-hydroxymuconate isomerase [Paraburkholderia phenoliruptrix]MBW9128133.1 5-carboxymethyl-2-hydroxymuconate isomerase [Paraburkholderia ginsengiterrae]
MPHLVILYSGNLDCDVDMTAVCRALADAMLTIRDEEDEQVFPTGGARVLAYPAPSFAIGDGGAAAVAAGESGEYGFAYLNLRMGRGRSAVVQRRAGEIIAEAARTLFAPLLQKRRIGLTFQIDVGPEVYDAKFGNLHPLFQKGKN